ncbi:MAG TPA: Uma2 family endonuclease [Myxococcota bacterium]|nr:Uma2 family endonuclease [Myxococcota bacterium]
MADLTPSIPGEPTRMTVDRYLGLVEAGVLSEDGRVELLEGVVVAMTPSNPPHAAVVTMATRALLRAVGERASVRTQCTLVLGRFSAPEPDVAVVPGSDRDYLSGHPRTALLVVEVADTSLQQDRITKAAIYAAAGIPEYWIVNLREGVVEVMRDPDREHARYRDARVCARGEWIELAAFPGTSMVLADLLPTPS